MSSMIPLKRYDDLEVLHRDEQTLQEAGFHPAVRRDPHDDRLVTDADVEAGGTLVLTVPETEVRRAMDILEASWEAQVIETEDYVD